MNQTPQLRYLEDIEVGMRFGSSLYAVTEKEIIAFATQYDPQPFHMDRLAAGESMFHGLAASGWHTASMTMRLFVTSEFRVAGGAIGAGIEVLEWPRPVHPGDTLHLDIEVLSVRASKTRPTRGIVVVRNLTLNQHDEVVQVLQPKLFIPKRPVP